MEKNINLQSRLPWKYTINTVLMKYYYIFFVHSYFHKFKIKIYININKKINQLSFFQKSSRLSHTINIQNTVLLYISPTALLLPQIQN